MFLFGLSLIIFGFGGIFYITKTELQKQKPIIIYVVPIELPSQTHLPEISTGKLIDVFV